MKPILKNNKKDAETPEFSIIIPVYNVDLDYFNICIDRILRQSLESFEVIIVDDGSGKECADACDQYAKRDQRIRVIHQDNNGVSAARNNGILNAKAEWIMFVDADDWIEDNTLEAISEYIDGRSYDIIFFDCVLEYANMQEDVHYRLKPGVYKSGSIDDKELLYLEAMGPKTSKYGNITYCWGKVYNRGFLLDNGIMFPESIPKSEDKVFVLQCLQKMKTLLKMDGAFYHYRINSASVCNSYTESADKDRTELIMILDEISDQMDRELGSLKGNKGYNRVSKKCRLFIFGIITDILRLKYYHKDYPRSRKHRSAEVKAFLNSEPYKRAVRETRYSELSTEAKFKKFLIGHGMPELFYYTKMAKQKLKGRSAK